MGIRSRRRVKAWIGSAAADVTAPTVTASQSFDYPEQSSAGAVIGTVAATDNFAVTGFRFGDTTTSTSADTFYSIDSAGVVTLTAAGETGANDFETATNPYTHPVQARDAAGNWSASVDVDFNITDVVEAGASMKVGVNTQYAFYSNGATPFANLMWNADHWQDTNEANYPYWADQDQHNVTNNTVPHVLVAGLASSEDNLPAGTYTVRNPDGRSISFGDNFGGPNIATSVSSAGAYTTATSFTFTLSANSALGIFTNSNGGNTAGTIAGAIQVILPDHVTSWDSGDYFNSAWVSYQEGLGTQAIRTMDWLGTNDNIFDSWSEQPTLTKTSIKGFGARYPLEVAIAAANRLNVPLWLNIPVRASDAWITSAASLIDASYTLPYLYVEYANEVWNIGLAGFAAQTNWVTYLPFTKITATCSGTTFTKTAHGLSNAQAIRTWYHKSGKTAAGERSGLGTYWLQMGIPVYVKVLTADTFEIWDTAALTGERADAGTVATQLLYVDPAEVGKTADQDANYGARAKEIWDILDGVLGSAAVKTVIGSQNGAASSVTARMSVTGVGARTNYVTTAPYYYGITMGGAVDRASTQFTPKLWSTSGQPAGSGATVDVAFRVYASGSTPRNDEIKAGTGTGYVGGSAFTETYPYAGTYTSGSAVTGLTNGTDYLCYFCVTDEDDNDWFWSQTIQASASSDTVDMLDTYENQKLRALLDIDGAITSGSSTYVSLTAVKDAAQAINASCELACYEGGNHQHFSRPAAITTWWEGFLESSENAEVVEHYLYTAAAAGCKLFLWYQDIGSNGAWTLADSNYDTADLRYQAVAAFSGLVPQQTKVDLSPINAGDITAAPGAFPYTVYTFTDPSLTYSIVSGNNEGNYQITGDVLEMVATTGINFAASNVKTLTVRATDGETDSFVPVSVNEGVAPLYESDARIAWDKFTDTDTTAMNPTLSLNPLPQNDGASPATIDGSGWWDFGGVAGYGTPSAMLDTVPYTDPFGCLWVGKRDNQASQENIVIFGTTNFIGFATNSDGSQLKWEWWDGGATEITDFVDWSDGNAVVAWHYFDPPNNKYYRGKNQSTLTGYASGIAIPATAATLNKEVNLAATTVKHGAFELVSRSGMTLANWLAIVQKYQDAFSIA